MLLMKLRAVVTGAVCVSSSVFSSSAVGQSTLKSEAASSLAPADIHAVTAAIDSAVAPIISDLMARKDIPGVAMVVVKDGKLIYKKGFGVADEINGTPVDPDKSIFHIGSVTKLFNATAAMQLYEAGKLDLHASVNDYLTDFKVPESFGKPITIANLLTHTGGLHYKLAGTVTPFGKISEPLNEHLAKALPAPARQPGFVSVYSDYGIALAGHVIEKASGERYQDYIQSHILTPLGMTQSGLVLTQEKSLNFAMPGASNSENYPPADFNYSNFAPATEIHASASDIAKFMMMQLGGGSFGGAQILKPETTTLMQTRQFSPHPAVSGWGYGFRERVYNGDTRAIGHGGSWFKHLGNLTLFPEHDLGIYVVMNQRYGAIHKKATQAVVDLFIPVATVRKPRGDEKPISSPLSQFAGNYTSGELTTTGTERLMMIAEPHTVFDIVADGNALISQGGRYYEVEEGFFLREDGLRNLVFTTDPITGDIYASFNGGGGNMRITAYETPAVQGILMLLVLVSMGAGTYLVRKQKDALTGVTLTASRLNRYAIFVSVAFIPLAISILLFGQELGLHIASPWWVDLVFLMPLGALFILVVSGYFIAQSYLNSSTDVKRAPLVLQAGSVGFFLVLLHNWNLI